MVQLDVESTLFAAKYGEEISVLLPFIPQGFRVFRAKISERSDDNDDVLPKRENRNYEDALLSSI